jgi:pSer/pThr/pTyr-binding forkhead associated (FHA) protein
MIATVVLVLRLALAIALYVFLGWALLTLWRDLKQQGKSLSGQKRAGISVRQRSERGTDRESHFFQTDIVLGRHTNCDIVIMDEVVSAQHARLTYHHGQWWLEDLSSTNGTFLNGSKLTTPTVVITDDEVKCGNTQLILRIDVEEELTSKK